MDGVGFKGHFTVELWEPGQETTIHEAPNRILRCGLVEIVTRGTWPTWFSTFAIGSDSTPPRDDQKGLIKEIPLNASTPNSRRAGTVYPNTAKPTWGYSATYEPGEATGSWAEIGMCTSWGVFINRALFINEAGAPTPVNKAANQRAIVTVLFTLFRH